MTTRHLIFFALLFTYGCKEKVAKFVVDNGLQVSVERYKYKYEGDKLVSQIETRCFYTAGIIAYRETTTHHYEYDDKGRLVKDSSKMVMDSLPPNKSGVTSVDTFSPTTYTYRYDSRDSLIEILSLEANGDTGYWMLYDFFPDGKQIIKGLTLKVNDGAKSLEEMVESGDRYYFYSREYVYANKLCRQIKEYDATGKLIKLTEKDYKDNLPHRPIKTVYYYYDASEHNPFSDSSTVRKETRYDNYSKGVANQTRQDFCLLDSKGDTITAQRSDFDEKGKLSQTMSIDFFRNSAYGSIFENDTLRKEITLDFTRKQKWVKEYFYYPNGKVRETRFQQKKFIE